MRIKSISLKCPKCKRNPQVKTIPHIIYFECNCGATPGWGTFHLALQSWINAMGLRGAFKSYEKVIKNSNLK